MHSSVRPTTLRRSIAARSRSGARSLSRPACHCNHCGFRKDAMLTANDGAQRDRLEMHNANALKIGLFGANCSSARTATLVPERWLASWPDCLKLARMADEAGIDFLLPIGRWKGYGGNSDFHGTTLETVTWACGLLAATRRITVFGTVHAPLFDPLIAAKEFVTADHIGEGRFGLNIVAGWNEGEFAMFGVQQREHADRYEFAQEWMECGQAGLVGGRIRFRRQIFQACWSACQSEAIWQCPPSDHERRQVRRRPSLRNAQLRRLLHINRSAAS